MKFKQLVGQGAAIAVILTLTGSGAAMQPPRPVAVKIRYQSSVCYGPCPAYIVTVGSNGMGLFEGQDFTAVKGKRSFRLSRWEFDQFARALEKYRFAKGGPGATDCGPMHTDDIGVIVTWTSRNGKTQTLDHYFGCDAPGFQAMEKALAAAPKLLPIKAFVGGNF